MTPTPGRIVLYRAMPMVSESEPEIFPGIVAKVNHDGTLDICTVRPIPVPAYSIRQGGEAGAPNAGTWNWPKIEGAKP